MPYSTKRMKGLTGRMECPEYTEGWSRRWGFKGN